MCDFTKGIRLSTSNKDLIRFRVHEKFREVNGERIRIPDKRNRDFPLQFIWRLFRFEGVKGNGEMGLYKLSAADLGNGLDAGWIALHLNEENCFDFDDHPNEGDNLFLPTKDEISPNISFHFRKGQWIIDHYDPFDFATLLIRDGIEKRNPVNP